MYNRLLSIFGCRESLNPKNELDYALNNRGLTLLEIAISMAILAIALVSLANLFPIGLKASRRAVNYSSASILAQRVIDNIKRTTSIDDAGDWGMPGNLSNDNRKGYFELTNDGCFPFSDDDLSETTWIAGSTYAYKYDYADTVYITVEDWDANGNNIVGRNYPANIDWDDVYLSQKVYVAVYWTEADRDRAETFITYISNPFYEKYK